ncbi:MAG: hypothetical protein ACFFBP_08430 [Promethearchaeota archaeon]
MELNTFKKEIPDIFEQVKKDVKKVLGRRRAGLSLGLVEMGMTPKGFIGAYHVAPGHQIIMNKTPLKIILEEQSYLIVKAYTYHVLLHEYIHSLGILDEQKCRAITLKISEAIFDGEDPAIILAKKGIGAYFPNLNVIYAPPDLTPHGLSVEYVSGFDKESQSYFS